jgi:hypothetical protein
VVQWADLAEAAEAALTLVVAVDTLVVAVANGQASVLVAQAVLIIMVQINQMVMVLVAKAPSVLPSYRKREIDAY